MRYGCGIREWDTLVGSGSGMRKWNKTAEYDSEILECPTRVDKLVGCKHQDYTAPPEDRKLERDEAVKYGIRMQK